MQDELELTPGSIYSLVRDTQYGMAEENNNKLSPECQISRIEV
jgi:hypothetical protein